VIPRYQSSPDKLGREIRETMSVEFAKLYWDLDKSLTAFGFFFPNVPLPSFIDRNRARKRIGEIFQTVINNRRANPGEVVCTT
jgi:sterol 14-demethylase